MVLCDRRRRLLNTSSVQRPRLLETRARLEAAGLTPGAPLRLDAVDAALGTLTVWARG